MCIAFHEASRSPAIWDWSLPSTPPEESNGWVGSANKATGSCDSFSWKLPTSRCALILNCEKNICTAAITNTSPLPRWRRLVSLRYGCIGCFVHRNRFHKFFHRGQPEMYSGQRKPDRQAE